MQATTLLKARLPDVQEKSAAIRFRDQLKVLTFIGFKDLADAGLITDDISGEVEFRYLKKNPWLWFICCDDADAEKLWALIERKEAEA